MGLTGCCAACPEAARLSATAVKQAATSWIFACRRRPERDLQGAEWVLSGDMTDMIGLRYTHHRNFLSICMITATQESRPGWQGSQGWRSGHACAPAPLQLPGSWPLLPPLTTSPGGAPQIPPPGASPLLQTWQMKSAQGVVYILNSIACVGSRSVKWPCTAQCSYGA